MENDLDEYLNNQSTSGALLSIFEGIILMAALDESREEYENSIEKKPGNTQKIKTYVVEYNSNKKQCPICLVDFNEGDINGKLPCKHIFHEKCIKTWFQDSNSCPICREEHN